MASQGDDSGEGGLGAADRRRLAEIRGADSLASLQSSLAAATPHDAYFEAKSAWWDLRGRELDATNDDTERETGVPGTTVVVDGHAFHVHGITHADTDAERSFLRAAVERWLADGETVYCEQGIRGMYFDDLAVCATDDYRWAVEQCRALDGDQPFDSFVEERFPDRARKNERKADRLRSGIGGLIEFQPHREGRSYFWLSGTVPGDRDRDELFDHLSEADLPVYRIWEQPWAWARHPEGFEHGFPNSDHLAHNVVHFPLRVYDPHDIDVLVDAVRSFFRGCS